MTFTFVLLSLPSLFCLSIFRCNEASSTRLTKTNLSSPQFDVVEHTNYVNQPTAQPLPKKVRVLNGHINCTNASTLLEQAAQKYQENEFDQAKIFWKHVLHQSAEDQEARAVAWYNLGHAYYQLNQPEKTIRAWEHAANQQNDIFIKAYALFNLFSLLTFQGKEREAQRKYVTLKDLLLNAQPRDDEPFHKTDILFYLSGVCEQGEEPEEAVKYYDRAWSHLERIGWDHHNKDTQVQAFKYLKQLAEANSEKEIVRGYQKNIAFLLNPPSIEDTYNT